MAPTNSPQQLWETIHGITRVSRMLQTQNPNYTGQLHCIAGGSTRIFSNNSAASSRSIYFRTLYNLKTVEFFLVPQRCSMSCVADLGTSAKLFIEPHLKPKELATFLQFAGWLVGFRQLASFSMISCETFRISTPLSQTSLTSTRCDPSFLGKKTDGVSS